MKQRVHKPESTLLLLPAPARCARRTSSGSAWKRAKTFLAVHAPRQVPPRPCTGAEAAQQAARQVHCLSFFSLLSALRSSRPPRPQSRRALPHPVAHAPRVHPATSRRLGRPGRGWPRQAKEALGRHAAQSGRPAVAATHPRHRRSRVVPSAPATGRPCGSWGRGGIGGAIGGARGGVCAADTALICSWLLRPQEQGTKEHVATPLWRASSMAWPPPRHWAVSLLTVGALGVLFGYLGATLQGAGEAGGRGPHGAAWHVGSLAGDAVPVYAR